MANYLRIRREMLKLTQKEVADAVGVSEGTISRYESENIENMKRDKILLYARVLKTTPNFILTGLSDDKESFDDIILDQFHKSPPYIQKSILSLLQLDPEDLDLN